MIWLPMKNEITQAAVLLVSAVPFQSWMGRQFAKLRVETATKTDKRIRLIRRHKVHTRAYLILIGDTF